MFGRRLFIVGGVLVLAACGQTAGDGSGGTGGTVSGGGASGSGAHSGGSATGGGGGLGGLGDGGCTGVPVPCADAGASCANNPGCHAQELCLANGCSVFGDASCESQPGCTWDDEAGTCVAPTCDVFDAGSCPTDAGCTLSSSCQGDAAACWKLETCAYPGCAVPL